MIFLYVGVSPFFCKYPMFVLCVVVLCMYAVCVCVWFIVLLSCECVFLVVALFCSLSLSLLSLPLSLLF